MNHSTLKSVGAVVAGLLVISILTAVTDTTLQYLKRFANRSSAI
jgi:hypothetical protein